MTSRLKRKKGSLEFKESQEPVSPENHVRKEQFLVKRKTIELNEFPKSKEFLKIEEEESETVETEEKKKGN